MSKDLTKLSSYQYSLPEELIAQMPCTPRDSSRLMVIDRATGRISEMIFRDLLGFLSSGDSLVFNDTKVIPARLVGKRKSGGTAEFLLVRVHADGTWDVLARPGKKLPPGTQVAFGDDFYSEILEVQPGGGRRVLFFYDGIFEHALEKYGQIPLPHYIRRDPDPTVDNERYQTVYAENPGAVAAPTAGLHFTKEMLNRLETDGIQQTKVTLHVGLGTFRPVQVEDITEHKMHSEHLVITPLAAETLNQRLPGKRQICVGTTSCRALETAATADGIIVPGEFETMIFIHPGYRFKYVQSMLTNFHLPGSTLLMLVSAFAGYELIMEAYAKAVKEKYRFFSYGDAMLIL
jgi:S-adenosylmethionine:tRNA ribosyltransferase-isomerase